MTEVIVTPTSRTTASIRFANVERLRVLAMLEIIGFHAASERVLFLWGVGLPIFLVLTNLFNCTVSDRRGVKRFTRDKFNRLFYPWLFWCAVYALLHLGTAWRHDRALSQVFDPWMLLYGTNVHLWFVPFALLSGIGVAVVQRWTRVWSHSSAAILSGCIGGLVLLTVAYFNARLKAPVPFPQYLYAMPSPFIGFALGRLMMVEAKTDRVRALRLFGMLCGMFVPLALVLPVELFAARYAIAAVLVVAALVWSGKMDRVLEFFMPLLFGIYLVHPLVIWLTKRSAFWDDYLLLYAVCVFVISALVMKGMHLAGLRRWCG